MFKKAQAQEGSLAKTDPAVLDLRRAANAYEAVVRRYPSSGYSDDALWQAAALMERAYGKSGAASDLDKAVQLLTWLRREYPASKHTSAAGTRLSALQPAPAAGVAAPAPPLPAAWDPAPARRRLRLHPPRQPRRR